MADQLNAGLPVVFQDGTMQFAFRDWLLRLRDAVDSSGGGFATLTGVETLTNKTLTSPVITQSIQLIAVDTTAVRGRVYVLTASLTLTLPAAPVAGDAVSFANRSGTATPVVARNGQNIMGLAEDMTLDNVNYFGTLVFADAARGWVFQ